MWAAPESATLSMIQWLELTLSGQWNSCILILIISEPTLDQWLWSSGSCEVSDVRSIVELWGPGTRSTFQHLKAFTHTQGQSPVGDSGQLYRQSGWCGVLGDRDSCTHRLCTLGSWYSSDTWTQTTQVIKYFASSTSDMWQAETRKYSSVCTVKQEWSRWTSSWSLSPCSAVLSSWSSPEQVTSLSIRLYNTITNIMQWMILCGESPELRAVPLTLWTRIVKREMKCSTQSYVNPATSWTLKLLTTWHQWF